MLCKLLDNHDYNFQCVSSEVFLLSSLFTNPFKYIKNTLKCLGGGDRGEFHPHRTVMRLFVELLC